MAAYTHLASLLSFLDSVLFDWEADVPQVMLEWLFSESRSQTTVTRRDIFRFLPPLFCVSVAFGKGSLNGSEGIAALLMLLIS